MLPKSEDYKVLFPPLTDAAIAVEQARLQRELPHDLVAFLRKSNGIEITGDYWFPLSRELSDLEEDGMNMSEIEFIYGVADATSPGSIAYAQSQPTYRKRVPDMLVPIASSNGRFVCLDYSDESPQVVLWADPDASVPLPEDRNEWLMPLTPTFTEFVESIESVYEGFDD